MKRNAIGVAAGASLIFLAAAFAAPMSEAAVSLTSFRGNAFGALQEAGGNTLSGQVSWNPSMSLGDSLSLRGNLGASLLKGGFSSFPAFNYQVLAGYDLFWGLELEAGGGMETWVDNGGTHPIVSGNLHYHMSIFGVFDRVFAGYSHFFLTDNGTHQARIGAGVSF